MAHILVVDDEADIRSAIAAALQQAGHTTSEAGDGRDAGLKIQAEKFDLMILDIMMPERSGLETIIHLQNENNRLPVIAITGIPIDSRLYLDVAEKLGASRSLAKPFTSQELLEVTREVLAQPSREGQP